MYHIRSVYVGIDVHRLQHEAAILPITFLEKVVAKPKDVQTLTLGNNRADYEELAKQINLHSTNPDEVAIAIDQTGRYSEPLVAFMQTKGYPVYFVEPRGVREVRTAWLDNENKTDRDDATSFAYLLYLKDKHGLPFRINSVRYQMGTKGQILKALYLQRLQYTKLLVQTINRLRQFLFVVFPEAENKYAKALIKLAEQYPLPQDLIDGSL